MILRIPVTATSMAEWVRRAATAVNQLIDQSGGDQATIAQNAAAISAVQMTVAALQTSDATQSTDIAALQDQAGFPFPSSLVSPSDPSEGQCYYSTADHMAYCWDGADWQALWTSD